MGTRKTQNGSIIAAGKQNLNARLTDPFVMGLVQLAVEDGNVQETMNPVDAVVGKAEEDGRAGREVGPTFPSSLGTKGSRIHGVVQHTPPTHISNEPGQGKQVEHGECSQGKVNLLGNLILEKARMVLHTVIKDEIVGRRRDGKVEEEDAHVGERVEGDALAENAVARQIRHGRGEVIERGRGETRRETADGSINGSVGRVRYQISGDNGRGGGCCCQSYAGVKLVSQIVVKEV